MTPGPGPALAAASGLAALAPASGGLEPLRPRGLAAEAAADDEDAAADAFGVAFLADVVRMMRLPPGDLLLRARARPSVAASSLRPATPSPATVAEPEAFVGAEGTAAPNGTGGFRLGGGGSRDEEAEADAEAEVVAGAATTWKR